jgi:hypothetical protein
MVRLIPEHPLVDAGIAAADRLGELFEIGATGAVDAEGVAALRGRPTRGRAREREHHLEAASLGVADERVDGAPARPVLRRIGGVEALRLACAAGGNVAPLNVHLDDVDAEALELRQRLGLDGPSALEELLIVLEDRCLVAARRRTGGQRRRRDGEAGQDKRDRLQ